MRRDREGILEAADAPTPPDPTRAGRAVLLHTDGRGVHGAMAECALPLTVQESSGRVRLCLGSLTHGDGPTLQAAADDLVQRLLTYVMALRASGFRTPAELGPPDLAAMDFLYRLGEFAAAGGDIRSRLFS